MSEGATDISLQCRCGRVGGVACDVSAQEGRRFVCYCRDCQAFARFLERAAVLDAAAGTDIFQMATGRSRLASATGPLPPDAPPTHSPRIFVRRASLLFAWSRRGVGRPPPFFDEHGAALAEPLAIARLA